MDSVPSVVLEVAVFNEDETELKAQGSEWMVLLQVQAAILVKVHHEENPIDDFPKISVGVWTRHHGQKVFTGYKDCGGESTCTQRGLPMFVIHMPWSMFFHGTKLDVPSHVLAAAFKLDMWHIRRSVQNVYQATRLKPEAASAAELPASPAQGRPEFVADRVKQRRRTWWWW
ncbi:TPA: hypothetical protein ACH3X3_009032 [Trebouxia sp. C0006]